MQLFEVNYEKPEDGDLYSISIVESPANGFKFIAMSSDKKELIKLSDKKKQLLTGVVLVPEQLIYREFEDGTPFNLKFSEQTIEKLSQDFIRKGYQLNSTFDHKGDFLDGTVIVEQWIIEDPNNDKANALGFKDLPKGTWMVTMKLSDELWKEYIETGKASGFSIDSFLDLKKVSMSITNKNNNKNKKEKMSLLKKLIKMFAEDVKLETIKIEGMGELTADAFELDNIVYVDVEGIMQPLVSQSFSYEGFKYLTDEDGVIVEKTEEAMAEEAVVAEPMEEEVVEEVAMEEAVIAEEVAEEVIEEVAEVVDEVEDVEALKAIIAELEAKIEILSKEKETIISENVEMKETLSKTPNSTKLKANEIKLSKRQTTTMDVLREVIEAGKK